MLREERIEALKDGVRRKLSASQIAAQYDGCTRNAVIGLSHRVKIKLGGEVPADYVNPKPKEPKRERPSNPAVLRIPDWVKMSPAEKADYIAKEAAKGLTWAQIADGLRNATRKAVRGCAERNGINLTVTSQARHKRAPEPRLKPVAAHPKVSPAGKVGIMDLENWHCRAPAWNERSRKPLRDVEEWVYCGHPRQHGSSYCPSCHSKFWEPVRHRLRYDRRTMAGGYGK